MKKKIVVLTGAGISAESGISTFRDAGGLWEGHNIMDVASYDGWRKDKSLVLNFYNQRRKQLHDVEPNAAHRALVELEQFFEVYIVTQNVDDLHERAGSSHVLHLHGELFKVRSDSTSSVEILHWETDLNTGDVDSKGVQLRPHIVWFGEPVPALDEAIRWTKSADYFIVIGTSLQVYPAASLMHYTKNDIPVYYVDPHPSDIYDLDNPLEVIAKSATEGVPELLEQILKLS